MMQTQHIASMPLGLQMNAAFNAFSASTVEAVQSAIPVVQQFESHFGINVPLQPHLTGAIDLSRWQGATAILFADAMRPCFDQGLEVLSCDDPYKAYLGAGLDKVNIPDLISAGLISQSKVQWPFARMFRGLNAAVKAQPEESKIAHPYYTGEAIGGRLFLYGLTLVGKVNFLPAAWAWFAYGGMVLLNEGRCFLSNRGAHSRYLQANEEWQVHLGRATTALESIAPVQNALDGMRGQKRVRAADLAIQYPEMRLHAIRTFNEGYSVRIAKSVDDMGPYRDTYSKYVVIQLPSGEYEIRIGDSGTIHPRFIVYDSGEKVVGAGYFEYTPSKNRILIDNKSTMLPTTDIDVKFHGLPGGVEKAERRGMNAVLEIFMQAFGPSISVIRTGTANADYYDRDRS
ncbi:MAG: hypothetical protein HN337_04645 [Deltaproteobacteria bacterium]|nr:hypothetical protein [Deltaproteobacteria bacterium]